MYGILAVVVWVIGGCISVYIAINELIIGICSALITLVLGSLCWGVGEIICRLEEVRYKELVKDKEYSKILGTPNIFVHKQGDWYCELCKMYNKEASIACSNCGTYRK